MIKHCKQLMILVMALWVVTGASAHQQKASVSTVLFNPRTQNIEIMHRFNLHDAEHAVKEIFGKSADILDSKQTQTQFAQYVAKRFHILTANGDDIGLNSVGFEVDGKHFWVYQETPQLDSLEGLQVRHDALRDIWFDQSNMVNIEGIGDIKTLTFTDNVELLSVKF